MKKNILALIMAFAMIFTMAIPAFASSAPKQIVVAESQNGVVTADKNTAAAGETVTLTVNPATGYQLDDLNGVTATKTNDTTYTFTMPDTGVVITPTFEAIDYTISGPGTVSNGEVTFSKTSGIHYNEDVSITVSNVASGYELSKLEYTTEDSQTPVSILGKSTFKMPASDIDVVAEFAPVQYSISLNYNSSMGSVTIDSNKASAGDTVVVNIAPVSARYEVSSVSIAVANSDTVPSYQWTSGRTGIFFTMPAGAVTVQVVFAKVLTDLHDIDIDCENRGEADTYIGSSKVSQARWDDVVIIDVAPDNYYAVETIVVTKQSGGTVEVGYSGEDYTFVMPDEAVTVDIDFYEDDSKYPYDISVDSDDGDYAVVVVGRKSGLALETDVARKSDTVRIYVAPDDGYVVDKVVAESDVYTPVVQYNSTDDYYWFKMPSDDTLVTIYYEEDEDYTGNGEYSITTSYSSTKGKITVQDSADEGEKVYITVKPKTGYVLDEIEVIEDTRYEDTVRVRSSSATKYYFTMPDEDVIVIATFVRGEEDDDDDDGDYYDIFVVESDHGDVDVEEYAESGDTVKIKVDEDSGYTVDEILVTRSNGKPVSVTEKSTYWTFTMPSSDVYIEVSYKKGSSSSSSEGDYDIDLTYNDDYGYVDVVDSADAGDKVYLYVEPEDDNEVDEIIIATTKGKPVSYKYNSSNDYYYFTMPAYDVEIEVTFVGEVDEDEDEDDDGYYTIMLDYDDDAGIVEVDDEAEEGEKVYIELDLDKDYTLDKIRVFEYTTGEFVNVKKSSATKYYFEMPEDDVFVIVTFESEEYDGEDTYGIDVSSNDFDLGNAEASRLSAAKGERVLVFIDPTSEYAVLDVIAERGNGAIVNVKQINHFCYEFTMPGSDVDVTVYFDEDRPLTYKDITLNYNAKQGEVYLSDEIAEKDDDINIFIEAKAGYELDSVSVKRTNGGKKVTTSVNKYGDYCFEMPDADVTVTVTFAKIEEKPADPKPTTPETPKPTEPVVHICPAKPYTDVNTTLWYHDAIDYVVSYNLMTGYSATLFAPNDNVSRAMIVTVLWRIAGQPATTTALPYTDVAEGQWYTEAVRWAAANGLLVNVAAGTTFEPNSTITREQFASVIYKYQKLIGGGYKNGWTHPLNFSDLNLMSAWALEPLTWCNEFGILNGVGYDRIDPQGTVTRAQLAQILLNLSKLDA